jgi:hypothetical protein
MIGVRWRFASVRVYFSCILLKARHFESAASYFFPVLFFSCTMVTCNNWLFPLEICGHICPAQTKQPSWCGIHCRIEWTSNQRTQRQTLTLKSNALLAQVSLIHELYYCAPRRKFLGESRTRNSFLCVLP